MESIVKLIQEEKLKTSLFGDQLPLEGLVGMPSQDVVSPSAEQMDVRIEDAPENTSRSHLRPLGDQSFEKADRAVGRVSSSPCQLTASPQVNKICLPRNFVTENVNKQKQVLDERVAASIDSLCDQSQEVVESAHGAVL
eukprot:736740-Hanusia_phi.AAC.1